MKKNKIAVLTAFLIASTAFAAAQSSVNLDVQKIKTEPVPLQTSEYADVWVKLTNTGSTATDNAKLYFRETYPFSTDPGEKTSWNLGKIVPGEEYHVHFQVKVDENAVQGKNTLKFVTRSGGTNITEKVPVEVRSDNNILSVENVEFPDKVAPGSSSEMRIVLRNHADAQLKNIQATIKTSKLPVTASDTTTKTVEKIEPGKKEAITYNINVDQNAENGAYSLPIALEYENEVGNTFTTETETGVIIGGKPELNVGINQMELLKPGQRNTISLRIVNRGFGDASFVQLLINETENFELLSPRSTYLGNMKSDDYQTAEYNLFVDNDAESLRIPVTLDYRTSRGEQIDTEKLDLKLYNPSEISRFTPGSGGSPIFLVILLLLVAAGVYYWRRRKKKREGPE